MSKIEELKAELVAEVKAIDDIAAKAEKREETGGNFTAEEREEVTRRLAVIEAKKADIKSLEGDAALLETIKGLGGITTANGDGTKLDAVKPEGKGTLGEQFAAHVGKSLEPFGGYLSEKHDPRGIVAPFELVGGQKAFGAKDLITGGSATSGGAIVFPQNLGIQDAGGLYQRPLTLRQVVTNGTTNTDTVEFVKVTGFTNAASPTPEATATTGTSGTKPESALTLTRVTETVKTIAHWIPATRRALSDAGQVRTIVDNFLNYGLEEELENQIVAGTGTGEDFLGLANDTDVQTQAFATDKLTTIRKAKTLVKTVGRANANAVLLNPADTEALDLTQNTTQGNFYFGGPITGGVMRVWGMNVVETEAVPANTAYIGDFRYCVLWDREQASITVGTINDQLVRNMVTILAEMRAAFGCFRPQAIVKATLA